MVLVNIVFAALATILLFWTISLLISAFAGAPSVFAENKAIDEAFKLAKLQKDELVVDLGCGDAKSLILAARKFSARGLGVEISPFYFLKAKLKVLLSGQSKKIKIVFGNFKKIERELKSADLLYLYLWENLLQKNEEWIFQSINPKARIVSLSFPFAKHKADQIKEVANARAVRKIYFYQSPID